MKKDEFNNIEVDLVFKCSKAIDFKNKYKNIQGDDIFQSFFWEKVFLCWLRIIIIEYESSIPKINLKSKSFSFGFEIIDNQEIAILNKKWLNKSGPTDVLSFPILSKEDLVNDLKSVEFGDIFISLEMAMKQSIEYNNSVEQEVIWLACHGFLHLLGWDHQDKLQLENMLKIQEYLISKLNNE